MNKKILSALLLVAIAFASTSMFVSCKDYDDDIKSLQTQIDGIQKTVDQINSLVTAGSVITNVEKTTAGDGGIIITLSNNQKYTISNGATGATGATGAAGKDAVIWTIGSDGYWYQDGVKTDYRAIGQDGAPGANGQDGAPGKDAAVWTIGSDGYWYQDGVKTDYKAIGQDGAAGANGQEGAAGKDGVYYVPKDDGWFYIVDPNTGTETRSDIKWKTTEDAEIGCPVVAGEDGKFYIVTETGDSIPTTISWKDPEANVISVAYNKETGEVIIVGVEGFEDGIVLATNNAIRSIVFEKDDQAERVYVDGVPGIRVASFNFNALKVTGKDSQAEKWAPGTSNDVINPATYAYYHINPSNANVKDLEAEGALSYIVKANAQYIKTRAAASNDFDVKPEFVSFENGILKVKVNVTGTAATDEKISVAALQLTKGNSETVTSDYTCIYNEDMDALRFYNKQEYADATANPKHYYHFRRMQINDVADYDDAIYMPARLATATVWDTQDGTDYDIELAYDDEEGKDLNDYVGLHNFNATAATAVCNNEEANVEALGLTVKYEIVKNYKIGTNNTDQKDFIKLDGSTITAKVFGTTGTAAIGRTPIIRASLMLGSKVVEVAYIKVIIVGEEEAKTPDDITINMGNVDFNCNGWNKTTTVEEINVNLYNVLQTLGISRETFYTDYTLDASTLPAYTEDGKNNIGVVEELPDAQQTETTHLYKWTLSSDDLWQNTDEDVIHVVKYTSASGGLSVTLKAHINKYDKTYNIEEPKYIREYWNSDLSIAKFNVNVPTSTSDTDDTNCLFENDPNSPFVTYEAGHANEGILKVEDNITDIRYEFHSSNANYGFEISSDGEKLYYQTELIATITNNPTTTKAGNTIQHRVELNKNSAKELLNSKNLKINIKAIGYVCGEETKRVDITFLGKEYFTALYVRPIDITENAADNFIDGVDFGERGSYINIKNLIAPKDWRGRYFGLKSGQQYYNYWSFYGPFSVDFNNTRETAQIKLNGEWQAIPATIVVEFANGPFGSETATDAQYGYITYKNNGTTLNADTQMRIKVTVNYGWGSFLTDWITVAVKKTI